MIFVTLGTQDKSFERLLKAIQKEIDSGTINEKVVVQAGCTKYVSKEMEIFDLVSLKEFEKYMDECDLLITHAGVGSIIDGIKRGKKVIAVPRLKKYGEHTNDHQLQIVKTFGEAGYIYPFYEDDDLHQILINIKKFKPKKYVSNNANFLKLIKKYIEEG